MFIQAFLGYLDKKKNRWESRPSVTVKTYCKQWLVIDMLSLVPYDAVVIVVPSHVKLKVVLTFLHNYRCSSISQLCCCHIKLLALNSAYCDSMYYQQLHQPAHTTAACAC